MKNDRKCDFAGESFLWRKEPDETLVSSPKRPPFLGVDSRSHLFLGVCPEEPSVYQGEVLTQGGDAPVVVPNEMTPTVAVLTIVVPAV